MTSNFLKTLVSTLINSAVLLPFQVKIILTTPNRNYLSVSNLYNLIVLDQVNIQIYYSVNGFALDKFQVYCKYRFPN